MNFLHSIFHLLQMILVCSSINSLLVTSVTNDSDRLALLSFKDKIHEDPLGALDSWNNSIHYCEWNGVICSRRHPHRVVSLVLDNKKLGGTLSPHIGNLSFLREITLTMNNFNGPIPQEIGHLFRLKYLWLNNNSFSGPIPTNLSHCSSLLNVNLIDNKLTGGIPVELTYLPKLLELNLGANDLKGSIPSWVGNLSSLIELSLYQSLLKGNIPEDLCRIWGLIHLNLQFNNLNGTVPSCLYNLTNLEFLSLSDNQLNGNLPPDIGLTLPHLRKLFIGRNKFNGPIPLSLVNSSNLEVIVLALNQFIGKVPTDLGRLPNLRRLYLHSNQLGSQSGDDLNFLTSLTNCSFLHELELTNNSLKGAIPKSIANLSTQITLLGFGTNLIYGSIPSGIENLVNLNLIVFKNNHLNDTIPPFMAMLPNLHKLYLNENQFSGEIPDSFGNSTVLLTLFLGSNRLHGKIPLSLANCTNLSFLYLDHNRLNGTIPAQVIKGIASSVLVLVLSNNALSGPLPNEVGNMRNLVGLDVSSNRLFGPLPDTLGNCIMLVQLSMKDNLFEGEIPKSLSTLRASLQELDLSSNKFSGEIAKYLVNFTFLSYLNLSYNELEGPVPKEGVFANASAISIEGNKDLCGGTINLRLTPCHTPKFKKKAKPLTVKVVIPVMVAIITMLLVSCLLFTFFRRRLSVQNLSPTSLYNHESARTSYGELLRATNSFSADNLIGSGSYGTVYKGILTYDNTTVAVKVFNLQQPGGSKSFLSECNALKNIRHRNLVKIVTCCSSIDFQGNEFKALVFEFMQNGSLEEWLFPKQEQLHELRNLNFLQRLNIAIDIASALDYLHHHCRPAVVHCDLKPSNILLDDDLVAHVADFGLAKIFSVNSNNPSQIQSTSLAIKGTVGYVAPEYGTGDEVSTKGDVYSYGILLLEMFTGKRPTDEMFQDAQDLHYFAETALPDQVMNIIDQTMPFEASDFGIHEKNQMSSEAIDVGIHKQNEMPFEASDVGIHKHNQCDSQIWMYDCLVSTIRVGVTCSTKLPKDRMDIGEAILELYRIKDHYHTSRVKRQSEVFPACSRGSPY